MTESSMPSEGEVGDDVKSESDEAVASGKQHQMVGLYFLDTFVSDIFFTSFVYNNHNNNSSGFL